MTYQPFPTNNDDEPEIILNCYPTLEGLISCASNPELILALYLKNLEKSCSGVPSTSTTTNPSSSSTSSSSNNNDVDPNTNPSNKIDPNNEPSNANDSVNDSDDDEHQKALDPSIAAPLTNYSMVPLLRCRRRRNLGARKGGGKLEEVKREKAKKKKKKEEEEDEEEDEEDEDEEDEDEEDEDDEDEEEECMKRMMLRQEVFADWKAGKHGFFYDEDMPELGVDDDRIYKMSLIREEPSWQAFFLEKIVREKAEFDRMENANREYDSDE